MSIIVIAEVDEKADNRREAFKLQRDHVKTCFTCATAKGLREKRDECKTFEAYCTLLIYLPK